MRSVFSRASFVIELRVNPVCACSLVRDGLVCGTRTVHFVYDTCVESFPGVGPVFSTERSAGLHLTALVVSHCFFMCDHVK